MRDFKKNRGTTHEIFNFFALCAGTAVVMLIAGLAGRAAWDMYTKFVVASRANDAAQTELAQLESQYVRVSAAVENFETARGEEGEIRERFGVAKPGEGFIQIVRNGTTTDAAQNPANEGVFGRLLRALFVW